MTALPMYIDEVVRLSIKPKQTTTPTYKQDRTYQEPTRFDLDVSTLFWYLLSYHKLSQSVVERL